MTSTITAKIFCGYFLVVGLLFAFAANDDMVNDMVHVDKDGNMCNACAEDKRGKLTDLSLQIGVVYCQVIGAMAVMVAMATYFEGDKMRTFMTMAPFIAVQAKHIFFNNLIPPVPVMVMGGATFAVAAYVAFATDGKGTDYGKFAFMGQMAINLAVFVAQPSEMVKETWAGADGADLAIGTMLVGVLQFYTAMFLVLFGLQSPLSHLVAMTLGMGQLFRDVVINESGPPMPVLVLFVGVFLSSAYGFYKAGDAKKRSD